MMKSRIEELKSRVPSPKIKFSMPDLQPSLDFAISVRNLSKKYRLYDSPKHRLKEALHPFRKKYHRDFWALRDISFEAKKGECIGIIGQNGSGKSTFLQIICGVLQPTAGEVNINGRVSALLELGAGFNSEFTGRNNVYMNGALMGFTKEEIDERFEQIAEFADIGHFIDQPVKTYSSGMYVRLAFACAVNVDPDILIVDEALAVGDFKFQQKCFQKINELRKKTTVVLVSHSMRDILMHCSRAMVLEKGVAVHVGSTENSVEMYLDMMEDGKEAATKRANIEIYGETLHNMEKIADISHKWVDSEGHGITSVEHGSQIVLEFSFRLLKPANDLVIGLPIYCSNGKRVTAINTDANRIKIVPDKDGIVKGRLKIDYLILNPGAYNSIIAIQDANEYLYRNYIGEFRVKEMPVYFDQFTPAYEWEFNKK